MTNKLVKFAAAVMTTLLALLVLWQFRSVFIYIVISLTLAAVLRPLAQRLSGQTLLMRVAWILLFIVALGSFVFFIFLTGKSAIDEIQLLAQAVSAQDKWRLPIWLEGISFAQSLIARLPLPSMLFEAVTGNQGQFVLPALLGFTQGLLGVVGDVFLILFLSIYWTVNQVHFERLWLSLLPSDQRKQARGIWRRIEPDLGAYIRSQFIHSLMVGLLLGLGYWALGSPYASLLALASALACLIPVVGTALAVVPTILVGLMTGMQYSLIMVLYTLSALIALGVWVRPRLFNRQWDNPILTLVILIAMANAFGLLGIILAPPLSAICQILWSRLVSQRHPSGAAMNISDLKERQERVMNKIKTMEGQPPELVISSIERLNQLIVKAESVLQTEPPDETSELSWVFPPFTTKGEPLNPQNTEEKGHGRKKKG
jgi:putative permease